MVYLHAAHKMARADAHKRNAVAVGLVHVGLYLEHKGREIGALRADEPRRRHARQRLGRKAQKICQKGLYPEVCQRRAKEHRRQLTVVNFLFVKLVGRAVQQLDVVAQRGVQRRRQQAVQVCVAQVRLNLRGLPGARFAHCFKGQNLFFIAHIYALELFAAANGPVHGVGFNAQHLFNFFQQVEGAAGLAVHLVHKGEQRNAAHGAHAEQLFRLRLHALGRVNHHHRGVRRHQRAVGVLGKILVAGRVKNVDAAAVVFKLQHAGRNRDAALLFNFHPV